MPNQIDQNFVQKMATLIAAVLSDEAKFVYRNDEQQKTLHNRLFTKDIAFKHQSLEANEKLYFKKYFNYNEGAGEPRTEVPFSNSLEDQIFFFENLQNQIKSVTYNFSQPELILPSFANKEATSPTLDENQTKLQLMGVLHPCLYAFEQREIARVEKKATGTATDDKVTTSSNPYKNLGNKVLVKGISGEFDQVLTLAQITDLAKQEDSIRSKAGLTQEQVMQELQAYISKTYPGLHLLFDSSGHLQTYIPGLGTSEQSSFTFKQLLPEMKLREGRNVQYEAITASKGTLGYSTKNFKITNADGVVTSLSGLGVNIDKAGTGNNAVFFVEDKKGKSGRVVVNLEPANSGTSSAVTIFLYDDPSIDLPGSPVIQVNNLDELTMPLGELYSKSSKTGQDQEDKAKDKPTIPKPLSSHSLGSGIPAGTTDLGSISTENAVATDLPTIILPPNKQLTLVIPHPKAIPASSYSLSPSLSKPKVTVGSPLPPAPKPTPTPNPTSTSTASTTATPQVPTVKPKIPADSEEASPETPESKKQSPSMFKIGTIATIGGIAAPIGFSIIHNLSS